MKSRRRENGEFLNGTEKTIFCKNLDAVFIMNLWSSPDIDIRIDWRLIRPATSYGDWSLKVGRRQVEALTGKMALTGKNKELKKKKWMKERTTIYFNISWSNVTDIHIDSSQGHAEM